MSAPSCCNTHDLLGRDAKALVPAGHVDAKPELNVMLAPQLAPDRWVLRKLSKHSVDDGFRGLGIATALL